MCAAYTGVGKVIAYWPTTRETPAAYANANKYKRIRSPEMLGLHNTREPLQMSTRHNWLYAEPPLPRWWVTYLHFDRNLFRHLRAAEAGRSSRCSRSPSPGLIGSGCETITYTSHVLYSNCNLLIVKCGSTVKTRSTTAPSVWTKTSRIFFCPCVNLHP